MCSPTSLVADCVSPDRISSTRARQAIPNKSGTQSMEMISPAWARRYLARDTFSYVLGFFMFMAGKTPWSPRRPRSRCVLAKVRYRTVLYRIVTYRTSVPVTLPDRTVRIRTVRFPYRIGYCRAFPFAWIPRKRDDDDKAVAHWRLT